MRRVVGALVALMLCSCAQQPVASTAPPLAAARPACDLSVDDAVAKAGAVKMTAQQYDRWNEWVAAHDGPQPPDGMWAYIAPYDDGFAILLSYQGCIVMGVQPFSSDELAEMFGHKI
jgi:hypothetical protein